jgi:hypothetical protein
MMDRKADLKIIRRTGQAICATISARYSRTRSKQ